MKSTYWMNLIIWQIWVFGNITRLLPGGCVGVHWIRWRKSIGGSHLCTGTMMMMLMLKSVESRWITARLRCVHILRHRITARVKRSVRRPVWVLTAHDRPSWTWGRTQTLSSTVRHHRRHVCGWHVSPDICGGELSSEHESGGDSGNILEKQAHHCEQKRFDSRDLLESELTMWSRFHCSGTAPVYWCPTHRSHLHLSQQHNLHTDLTLSSLTQSKVWFILSIQH